MVITYKNNKMICRMGSENIYECQLIASYLNIMSYKIDYIFLL